MRVARNSGGLLPDTSGDLNPGLVFAHVKPKKFRSWTGNQIQIFQQLSTVVVAGMHVTSDADLQPSIKQLTCPVDGAGTVQLPTSAGASTFDCTPTGANLTKLKLLRLRSDSDSITAEGPVHSAAGDDTTATVSFPLKAMHALPGTSYKVFSLNSTGVESDTGRTLQLSTMPWVSTTVTPTTLDMSALPAMITLTGNRLEQIKGLRLINGTQQAATLTPVIAPSPDALTISFQPTKPALTKLGTTSGTLTLEVEYNDGTYHPITATMSYVAPTL